MGELNGCPAALAIPGIPSSLAPVLGDIGSGVSVGGDRSLTLRPSVEFP